MNWYKLARRQMPLIQNKGLQQDPYSSSRAGSQQDGGQMTYRSKPGQQSGFGSNYTSTIRDQQGPGKIGDSEGIDDSSFKKPKQQQDGGDMGGSSSDMIRPSMSGSKGLMSDDSPLSWNYSVSNADKNIDTKDNRITNMKSSYSGSVFDNLVNRRKKRN